MFEITVTGQKLSRRIDMKSEKVEDGEEDAVEEVDCIRHRLDQAVKDSNLVHRHMHSHDPKQTRTRPRDETRCPCLHHMWLWNDGRKDVIGLQRGGLMVLTTNGRRRWIVEDGDPMLGFACEWKC